MNDVTRSALLQTIVSEGMQDFQRITTLCHLALQSQDVHGDICEFGVFRGKTAALLASLTKKNIWLYDWFEGLPVPGPHDGHHPNYEHGAMKVSPNECLEQFEVLQLPEPHLVIKEFRHLSFGDIPESIAMAHVDCDQYESTKKVLSLIWPFMSGGGIIVVDDYGHPDLPGVKLATDEYFLEHRLADIRAMFQPKAIANQTSLHCYVVR